MSTLIPPRETVETTRPWLEVLAAIRATEPPPIQSPRPTIDVEAAEASPDRPKKENPLLGTTFWCDTVVDAFRELQLQKILRIKRCGYTEAKEIAEDPDPYEKEYVFYCLHSIKIDGIAFRRR